MKTKLTVTVDEEILPGARAAAAARGTSLSQLVENMLRELAAERRPSFSQRWRGRLELDVQEGDPRYQALVEKYLS
jgi:hypothetical protein